MSRIYPAERLDLAWLRGDTVLKRVMGDFGSSTVQSDYRFTPLNEDSGEDISCRATLELQDLPDETRETTVPLNILCESCSPESCCPPDRPGP